MSSYLDNYFLELTDKLAFLTLEQTALKGFDNVPNDFSIPVFVEDIKSMGNSDEGLSTKQISSSILYLLGIDKGFKFSEYYINFLNKAIDRPDSLASELAMKKYENANYKDAMMYMRAAILFNNEALFTNFNYAQIALEFSRSTKNKVLAQDLVEEAKVYLNRVLEINPDEPLANYQLGLIMLEEDNLDAKKYFEVSFEKGDDEIKNKSKTLLSEINGRNIMTEVDGMINEGLYEKSLEMLNSFDFSSLPPVIKYRYLYLKGFCNKALGNFEDAIKNYELALEINNSDTFLLAELGVSYAYIGDFEQSLEFYMSALDLDRESVEILNNISIVYLNMNNIEKAKQFINYAKELSDNDEIVDATILKIREIEENEGK